MVHSAMEGMRAVLVATVAGVGRVEARATDPWVVALDQEVASVAAAVVAVWEVEAMGTRMVEGGWKDRGEGHGRRNGGRREMG